MRFLFSLIIVFCIFFFFKQKTAYEMRISDWSSDVCSSDLVWKLDNLIFIFHLAWPQAQLNVEMTCQSCVEGITTALKAVPGVTEIGRASCRERGCQYV